MRSETIATSASRRTDTVVFVSLEIRLSKSDAEHCMMRDRRDVLRSGAGLAALSLAGCVEQDQPGGTGTEDGEDPAGDDEGEPATASGDAEEGGEEAANETSDADAVEAEASFEITSSQMPESPEIGQAAEYRVTVVNTGAAEGRFTSPVSGRVEGGEWRRIGDIDLQVRAGGEGIYRGAVTPEHLGRYEIRLDAVERTYEFQTAPRQLEFGGSFRTPNDVVVTVEDVLLRGSYPYFEDGERQLEYARRDRTFAMAVVTAENDSAYVRKAPAKDGFILIAGGDQYDPVEPDPELAALKVDRQREMTGYSGGRTYTGVTRRGVVFYEVPDTVNANTPTRVSMNEAYDGQRVSVTWLDG